VLSGAKVRVGGGGEAGPAPPKDILIFKEEVLYLWVLLQLIITLLLIS